jgi:RND family efflux transporter MFP subunit
METSAVKRPGNPVLLSIAALVIIAVAVWGYSRWGREPAAATGAALGAGPVVVVVEAMRAPISRTLELTGSVEAVRTALLASPAEGPVQDLRVLEGDPVRPGGLLLTIGRRNAVDASLAYAREAERREAEELERVGELVRMGALPSEQLDQARVNYERARAQLQQAEQLSGDYQVLAPWSGVVSKVHVHDGNYVGPRAPLVEIFDPASLVVRVAVPEGGAATVREGMRARVLLDAYPGQALEGRISRIFPELDRQTRTRTVEVKVSGADLAPGMFARVSFELEQDPQAVVVPDAAVVATAEGGLAAFVVRDSTVTLRPVTVGIESGRRLQILSGIGAGELVVVSGQRDLREGMAVRPRRQTGQGGGS